MQNTESSELVSVEEPTALIPATDVQARVDTMLANRQHIIDKVKPLLIEGVDIYTLPGMKKPSLGKPGAEKMAAIFGLTAKFEVDKETMEVMGATINDKKYIAYVCNLSAKGRVAGQGRGATFLELQRNSYRMIFKEEWEGLTKEQLLTCQGPLQGKSKSTGAPYTYWRIPEAPVFDPLALNKAIKMAQKSAFVDAVIRTTGMSDLFTQDLEDGAVEVQPEPEQKQEQKPLPKVTDYSKTITEEPFPDNEPVNKPSDEVKCSECGSKMIRKNGSRGAFMACSSYPKCKKTMSV